MNRRREVLVSALLVTAAALAVGAYALLAGNSEPGSSTAHQHAAATGTSAPSPVRLSAENAGRIGVTYATAEFGPLTSRIRTVGQVTYDETRMTTVNPRIDGWVEQLFVDFTGAPVRKGQPMIALYSPLLVSAQEELILARRLVDQAQDSTALANAQALLEAARLRLSYWEIADDEIARIERAGSPQRTVTLRAPASGLVIEKNIVAGARIMPGMDLYRIADLSTVWIEGEVFEKDLAHVTLGRSAQVTLEAYPDHRFRARVAYVYPIITEASRTSRIRVELQNRDLLLKPGMYATLEFEIPVHVAGLHVPRSAVLQTGERSVVFVRATDGALVPRQVHIGFATSEHAEILNGLRVGETVVASANFLIDAESNLGSALRTLEGSARDAGPAQPKHTVPAPRQ
jgi:Cu(I)/Ag(I) efflux system membrane fusion protein